MSTEINFDEETRAALLLFNERIEAERADERATKRVAKAERAKTDAAAKVRSLSDDSKASSEQKAEAEEAYKVAVAEFTRISADPHADDKPAPKKATQPADEVEAPAKEDAAATEDAAPTETSADEDAAPTETSADEEPQAPTEVAAESE